MPPAQGPASLLPVSFVLVEPSHPGNVGAAARALRAMGFGDLRLVAPRIPQAASHPDAVARASGALDVLRAARVSASFEDAIADATLVVGLSARTREFAPPRMEAVDACSHAVRECGQGGRVAFAFGTERVGLTNEQAQRCDVVAHIDADPVFSSLNVAQAVQVVAYELRRGAGVRGSAALDPETPDHATHEEIERFHAHFLEACVAIGFIDPAHPKKLAERMRRLFARTRLEREEVQLLRGLCKQMIDSARGLR